VGVQQLLLLN